MKNGKGAPALLLVSMLGCAQAPAPPAGPFDTLTLGLCEDYPEETRTLGRVREDLALLQEAGVRHLRVSIGWDGTEPERDRLDWSFWDALVAEAGARGIVLLPYVCYTPAWNAPPGEDSWRRPPSDVHEFAEFVGALAARYRGSVRSWELWNEPDNPAYWTGTVEEYAALVREGSSAIRRADPAARVVLGGLAWNLDVLHELLVEHGIARHVDVVNLHAYHETWSGEPLEGIVPYLRRAADLLRLHGEGESLWLAEVGYASHRPGPQISEHVRALWTHEHTPEAQAGALVRTVALVRAVPEVEVLAWYELRDLPPRQAVIGDENNRHLGVLDAAGRPKPALGALRLAARVLGGPLRPADAHVAAERPLRPDGEVRAFARPDGSLVLVGWLRTRPQRGGAPLPGALAHDRRAETWSLVVPGGVREVRAYDATGKAIEPPPLRRSGGGARLRWTLRGGRTDVLVLS